MAFWDDIADTIRGSLRGDIDTLLKSDADALPEVPQDLTDNKEAIGQKSIISDPFFDNTTSNFIFRNKMSRVSNKTLKDVSLRDWTVSAIIQARCDTMLRFARPQRKHLDMGFKIQKKNHSDVVTAEEKKTMADLEDFIYNCGRKENVPAGGEMMFGEFLKLTTRDALTFGHVAVEKVFTNSGAIHRFRPVPAEQMYIINPKTDKHVVERELENALITYKNKYQATQSNNPEASQEYNIQENDFFKYVQMSFDNRILSAFGDNDMIFTLFNPQNFADSMGYCYSPLELAILNVTNHLNIENYNANFFTHGYAARGVLHLKGVVTQAQLTAFRRQFYNTITGTQNAWRTPIVSGLDEVQWVPLSGSAKEMEYLNYNNHIMRAICSQFQIDPLELGLDYLVTATGRAASNSQSNEYKINYSRERGLIPILMMFEDMMNGSVLPSLDKELANKYEFKFTGYDDESPQTFIAQQQAEMSVHSSMNDLLRAAGKQTMSHDIADLTLNETLWQLVEKNITRGEIREHFFGDKAAIGKRELAYIPGDPSFFGWNQMILTIDSQRQQMEQAKASARCCNQQQAQQAQMQQNQDGREQEAHDASMNDHQSRQASAAVDSANAPSLKDSAKTYGLATHGLSVGGETIPNPINTLGNK